MGRTRKSTVGRYMIDLPRGTTKDYCEKCGEGETAIETHRILPGHSGGLYTPGNVISLCISCHRKEHGRMKKENDEEKYGFSKDETVACRISKDMKYRLKHISITMDVSFENLMAKILNDFLVSVNGKSK